MSDSVEKIYCTEPGNNSNDCLAWASMMNNSAMGGWNNPFIYLVWMMFAQRMWGNGYGYGCGDNFGSGADNFNSRAISQIKDTLDTNHNNEIVLGAMRDNQAALRELAQTFNTDINTIQQAICCVKSSIENVAGHIGFSAERVINAVNLGNANLTKQISDGLCGVKSAIIDSNYQNQLATERQTNILGSKMDSNHSSDMLQACQYQGATISRIDQLANGVTQGFASIGYQASRDTADIINAIGAAQQKTADQLNNHWTSELSQSLQDAKFEISQLKQNQYLSKLINCGGCNC